MSKIEKNEFWSKSLVVLLGALIACGLWGSAFPCIKIGYSYMKIDNLDSASQILYAGARFSIAGIMVIIFSSISNRKFIYPKGSGIWKVGVLSFFQTICQYLFFYIGLARTTGVKASILNGTSVFFVLILSTLVFKIEKMTSKKLIGCLIGFIGVIVVNVVGTGSGLDTFTSFKFIGEGFIMMAAVSYGLSSIFIKTLGKNEDPVMLSGYQFLFGGLVMAIVGFLAGGRFTCFSLPAAAMLAYLSFISAAAYSIWAMLLKYNPLSKVAVYGFTNPIFGVLFSAILLDETNSIGFGAIIALILVCAGIYLVNMKDSKSS